MRINTNYRDASQLGNLKVSFYIYIKMPYYIGTIYCNTLVTLNQSDMCIANSINVKHECFVSCLITCEVDVWGIDAFVVHLTLCAVTHYHPAAVGARVSCRGWRQDQLTVLVTVLDAGGGKNKKNIRSLHLHQLYIMTNKLMSACSSTWGVSR